MKWMNTESIIQSEVSQKEEKILYFNPYILEHRRKKGKRFISLVCYILLDVVVGYKVTWCRKFGDSEEEIKT